MGKMPSIFHQLLHDSLDLATFDQNPVAQTFIKDSEVTTSFFKPFKLACHWCTFYNDDCVQFEQWIPTYFGNDAAGFTKVLVGYLFSAMFDVH